MIYKDTQSGRSMVEVMGYMAAVMAIVAGISKLITRAYSEYKISKASVQLADLAGSILKSSTVDVNYENIVNMVNGKTKDSRLNKEGRKLIPTTYKVVGGADGNKIYNAFGGEVTIGTNDTKDKFYIKFEGLSREQCIEMGMKEWQNNRTVDLDSIVINGNYWYWPIYASATANTFQLPTTRSALAGKKVDDPGQCNLETGNIIMWIFNQAFCVTN